MQTKRFISVDWGTTALRLRLVNIPSLTIVATIESNEGVASTCKLWKESKQPESQRLPFYQAVLQKHIDALQAQCGSSLGGTPVVVSGMASSTLGMYEMAYKTLPVNLADAELNTELFAASDQFPHTVLLVSGVASTNDVMRGEEVQVAGCYDKDAAGKQLFIVPGTHSKHVMVEDGVITDFNTYMTGEVFALLSQHSILAASVE